MTRLLTSGEAARRLGVSRPTLRKMRDDPASPIPTVRPTGPKGHLRYPEDALQSWIKRHRTGEQLSEQEYAATFTAEADEPEDIQQPELACDELSRLLLEASRQIRKSFERLRDPAVLVGLPRALEAAQIWEGKPLSWPFEELIPAQLEAIRNVLQMLEQLTWDASTAVSASSVR